VSRYVDEHRGRFGVEPICKTLGVSVSAYYQRRSGRRSARAVEDERLLARIGELHAANYYAYGYRRMWKTLRRAGEQLPRCQVQRLMKRSGIVGAKRRGKPWRTTRPDAQAAPAPDLVQRDFSSTRPNELWVADLSYLRCWEGLVFFAFVIDAFSRMVVRWQLAAHMRTDLVLDALRMALGQRGAGADVELIHHTDRGSQYTSIDYSQTLDDHGVLASVGSVGDAYDNALEPLYAPQPGFGGIPELVEDSRRAGLPVELREEGNGASVPQGVALAAYRIVQESLTNVRKHAGRVPTTVVVRRSPRSVELDVVNAAGRRDGDLGGSGRGLAGMRERARIYGGTFAAGPLPDGGFAVRAILPLEGPDA
jgi:putative transposase